MLLGKKIPEKLLGRLRGKMKSCGRTVKQGALGGICSAGTQSEKKEVIGELTKGSGSKRTLGRNLELIERKPTSLRLQKKSSQSALKRGKKRKSSKKKKVAQKN